MFEKLVFDEFLHDYQVDGESYPSVSKLLENFYPPFDNKLAYGVAKRDGISVDQVLKQWQRKREDAAVLGSSVHKFGENYIIHKHLVPTNDFEQGVYNFLNSLPKHYQVFATEFRMYSAKFKIAGTADLILFNTKTKKYIICDYKTNENIYKNYKKQKMNFPFGKMLNHSFNKFQIQLSYYRLMLEEIGLEVENCFIIWLNNSKKQKFSQIKCKNYTKKLFNYHVNRRLNSKSANNHKSSRK